jgi:hypothetical protein
MTGHGTSFVIEFVLKAFPAVATFTLRKDGNTIPATSHTQLDRITTAVYLEITDAQFSDAGIYTLEVSNTIGSSSREFTLMISAPPGIVSSPMNHVVLANSSLSVSCTANITSTISWRVGSTELMNSDRFLISNESESSSLTVSSVTEDDSGLYSCTAAIGSGTPSSASFEVTILPFPNVVFISVPSDTRLAVDEVAQFRCAAYVSTLYPDMTLAWTDVNSSTPPSEEMGFSFYNETLEASGILFVTSVLTFSGSAQPVTHSLACSAHVLTATISRPFTLTVEAETATLTIEGPTEIGVESTLSISCHADAINFDLIYFVHNEMILTSTDTVSVSMGTQHSYLMVHSVEHEDAGLYTCVMNSGGGGGTASAELNVTVREGE